LKFQQYKEEESKEEDTLLGLKKSILAEIATLSELVKQKVNENSRNTIYNMIINRVHARDSIGQMLQDSVEQAEDFFWCISMKYSYVLRPALPQPAEGQGANGAPARRGRDGNARSDSCPGEA